MTLKTLFARTRLPILVSLLCVLCLGEIVAIDVTVSGSVVGSTPRVIGVNSGHYMPGSNTTTWWKYASVNGARLFTSANAIEGADDNGVWGDGVTSQGQFLARRDDLRADVRSDPQSLNTNYINWPHFQNNYATNDSSRINYQHAYQELHDLGAAPLAIINRTVGSYPIAPAGTTDGWKDRWEHWQHYYAQAHYLSRNYGVSRFQMYNEPDHSSQIALTQEDYLDRLRFASDAIQSAIADVNQTYGKSLQVQVMGPVTAGGSTDYGPRPGPDSDPRDDVTGWGELVINNLHTNFLGQVDPDFQLVHTYAYQSYNKTGPTFGSELAAIKGYVNADAPGEDIGYAITEFNVHSAAVFENTSDTLESPGKVTRLGSIFANLANNQPDELYVFKFSQTEDGSASGVKKNGLNYVDNDVAPYNIGGVTRGGAAVRLFARGFAGGHELLAEPLERPGGGDLHLAASYHPADDYYYLMSVNDATHSEELQIDFSRWGLSPGVRVQVEEVSDDHLAEVTHLISVPQNRIVTLTQKSNSVLLLSAPGSLPDREIVLSATDDAMVKSGGNQFSNYGSSANLVVKNTTETPGGRNASFVKFDSSTVGDDAVERAVLRLVGENVGTDTHAIAHVYGLSNDDWDEQSINWSNAPNLADSAEIPLLIDSIDDNFVRGVSESAEFLGHLTADASLQELSIDVSDFVRGHGDQQLTFLIVRELRFNGDRIDDDFSDLRFASKERGADPGPTLLLSLRSLPTPGDYDGNGTVGVEDYMIWKNSYGQTGEGLSADGNGDSVVDSADYTFWRDRLEAASAVGAGASSALVPEPASAISAAAATVMLLYRRHRVAPACGRRRTAR